MHTNSTTNYSLPQFLPTDKPAWLTDVNPAYLAIDNAMKANADAADAAQTDATQALADAAGANAIATQADAKASGAVASLSEQFLDTNTYSVGEYVIFNNILYVCIEPVTTPGPWTGSVNWERASLDSIATELNNKTGADIPMTGSDSTKIATAIAENETAITNATAEIPGSITLQAGFHFRGTPTVIKRNNVVMLQFNINADTPIQGRRTLGVLSAAHCPPFTYSFTVQGSNDINGFSNRTTNLLVASNGELIVGDTIIPAGTQVKEVTACVTYIV